LQISRTSIIPFSSGSHAGLFPCFAVKLRLLAIAIICLAMKARNAGKDAQRPSDAESILFDEGSRSGSSPAYSLGSARARHLLLCTLFFLVSCLTPFQLGAQTIYGGLTGTITDASGLAVLNATVAIRNVETGVLTTIKTNRDGVYTANTLQPGNYSITVSANGFRQVAVKDIAIAVNATRQLDEKLSVGSVTAEVTVTDAAPPLQTERADVSYEISTKMLEDLPTTSTTGQNFQSLYALVPGAQPPVEQNSASGNPQRSQSSNVNGAPNIANSTKIDGAINIYPWVPYVIAYVPPQDAIASVNFSTNSFNAEQGLAGGAAINVIIKSGTSKFHGTLYEINQSTPYNAKTWNYQFATVPKNMFNEFGGSIGGPILKNKLFFFFDMDRFTQRKTLSANFSVIDKNSAIAKGDFSAVTTRIYNPATGNADGSGRVQFPNNQVPVSSVAQKLIASLPTPTLTNVSGANYAALATYSFDRYHMDSKINYNPNNRMTMFGRYSQSPSTINDPQAFGDAGGPTIDGGQPGIGQSRIQNVGLGITYTFSPSLLFDSNAGYTRQRIQYAPPDLATNYGSDILDIPGTNGGSNQNYGGHPLFQFISGGFTALGNTNPSSPGLFRDNQYSYNANLTYLLGRHSFRGGFEYTHAALNHFQPSGAYGPRGGFIFSGGVTSLKGGAAANQYNSLADFLLGLPQQFGKATQIRDPNALRFLSYAFYLQDTFKVTSNLVLNYGLRYERYPFATRDHTGVYRYDPVLGKVLIGGLGGVPENTGATVGWGMVVPRFGMSYRLDDKTVVRSGFGMTIDPDNFRYLRDTYPAVVLQSYAGAATLNAAGCLNSGSYVPLGGCLTNGVPAPALPDLTAGTLALPSTVSTQTVPKDYRKGYLYTYNVAFEHQLPGFITATITGVGMREVRAVSPININAGTVGNGTAGRPLNILYGQTADVMQATPSGSVKYSGLQVQASSRHYKRVQAGIVYTWSHAFDMSSNSTYGTLIFQDPAYYKRNHATSDYDRTNNLQIWSVLQSPFGRGGIFLKSGLAGWVLGGWQLSVTSSKVSGTPLTITATGTSLNAPGSTQVADQINPNVQIYKVQNPQHKYFDTTAYAAVTAVRFGTSGRNSLRGPGYFTLNTAIYRSFPLWRESSFRFGVEAFDVTNTPGFNNPGTNVSSPGSFGVITGGFLNRNMRLSGKIRF